MISELVKIEKLSHELLKLLEEIDPGKKSTSRQIAHQLTSGSKDERGLIGIVKRIGSAKANLILYIQVACVGLSRDSQRKFVANTAEISDLDRTIKNVLGDGRGLKIANLIKNQPLRGMRLVSRSLQDISLSCLQIEDGTVVLDPGDLSQIGKLVPNEGASRIIVGNMTRLQALQINGPVGEDEWISISHLEVKDNNAVAVSTQVNYPVSFRTFLFLLLDNSIKYILLFVLIYLAVIHFTDY